MGVGSEAMVLVNVHIGGGQKPGGHYGAGMFYVITINSVTVLFNDSDVQETE